MRLPAPAVDILGCLRRHDTNGTYICTVCIRIVSKTYRKSNENDTGAASPEKFICDIIFDCLRILDYKDSTVMCCVCLSTYKL